MTVIIVIFVIMLAQGSSPLCGHGFCLCDFTLQLPFAIAAPFVASRPGVPRVCAGRGWRRWRGIVVATAVGHAVGRAQSVRGGSSSPAAGYLLYLALSPIFTLLLSTVRPVRGPLLARAATAPRLSEPAWHRRARRRRGDARALLRVAAAARLVAAHHSHQPSVAAPPTVGMGRWNRGSTDGDYDHDDNGWTTVRRNNGARNGGGFGRGQSRGGGGGGGGRNGGGGSSSDNHLKEENSRLKAQLQAAQREREMATDQTRRPAARDSRPRPGDWLCAECGFSSNRPQRGWCYRCAQPKSGSFPPNSKHVAAAADGANGDGAGVQAPTPLASAKAIRAKLDTLVAARRDIASVPGCEVQVQRLDEDINGIREELAAQLPVEVAVKGTLGPVAQARAAVQKAESKLAKLEGQIVALMSAHAAASAELADQKERLSSAEAATARAATSALPQNELAAALAANPAAVWSALLASIQMRVPGMPAEVVEQLNATTNAMQRACALLPAHPTSTPQAAHGGAQPSAAAAAGAPPVHVAAVPREEAQPPVPQPPPQPLLDPAAVARQAEAAAAATAKAAALQWEQQQKQAAEAAAMYEQERKQRHLATVAAASAAALAQAQAQIDAAVTPVPVDDGGASGSGDADRAAAAAAAAAAAGAAVSAAATSGAAAPASKADDSMSGTADDQVARKRALEEAAKLVSARAKAKA